MDSDPFFWSIDQVVAYLCYATFPWAKSSLPRPDPTFLEERLREHDVNGELLLTEIDRNILLQDFLLKSLGQRATIFKAIQYLRSISAEYSCCTNQLDVLRHINSKSNTPTPIPPIYIPISNNDREPQHIDSTPIPIPISDNVRVPRRLDSTPDTPIPIEIPIPNNDRAVELSLPTVDPSLRKNENFVVAGDGRKRRRLNLQTPQTSTISPQNPLHNQPQYLPAKKLPVADIFYQGIESDDEDDFSFVRNESYAPGQSVFVNRQLHHYFQQTPQPFEDGVAVFPYNKTAIIENTPQYFTLFRERDKRVRVSKEEIGHWPHLSNRQAGLDFILKKYPPQPDTEDVFPLYGDSGSENDDYDSETWQEMNEGVEGQTAGPKNISLVELDTIIDDCITGFIEKWKSNKLPVEDARASRLWLQSRRKRTFRRSIHAAKNNIFHLEKRLNDLRKAIKGSQWTKKEDVQLQCIAMENTIIDRELQKWKIEVLERDTCPQKPQKQATILPTKPSKQRHQLDDEESLSSMSDSFIDKSDLSDFVPEEYPVPTTNVIGSKPAPPPKNSGHSDGPFVTTDHIDLTQYGDEEPEPAEEIPEPAEEVPGPAKEVLEPVEEVPEPAEEVPGPLEVHTPPLNPIDGPSTNTLKTLDDDYAPSAPKCPSLPDISDIRGIRKCPTFFLEERRDRKRLLAKLIYSLTEAEQTGLTKLLESLEKATWRSRVRDALYVIRGKKSKRIREGDNSQQDLFLRLASLYVSWLNIKKYSNTKGIRRYIIAAALKNDNLLPFYDDLTLILLAKQGQDLLKKFTQPTRREFFQPTQREPSEAHPENVIVISDQGSEEDVAPTDPTPRFTPRKKRVRAVKESVEALDSQERARRRLEEEDKKQKRLFEQLHKQGLDESHAENKIISFDQPIICLDPHIGRLVKDHQLVGIRFLWRELVKDEKGQGCLLAHTMGLGKTMQVISFLVAVASASNSSNKAIQQQIPERLRQSRTLILCPSSLIQNWREEFLRWTPSQHFLGQLHMILPSPLIERRLRDIDTWYKEGGILLISYSIFRATVLDKSTKARARLTDDQHEIVQKQLLEGPSIVVADEAHQMKNRKSAISEAATRFKTKSRIALTGSPLANNLTDYYSMIDWISPGYLGNFIQFKAKYIEPIEAGLYADSTSNERRRSLKKLEVLKVDLAPKINRADISVLEADIPSKVEFVITLPLTTLQESAFKQYIQYMSKSLENRVQNARLWDWLAILSLLCNHPACFIGQLKARQKAKPPQTPPQTQLLESDSASDELPTPQLPDQFMVQLLQTFANMDTKSPTLSYRTLIADQIIEESVRVGDKVLVFSHSIPTLNYLQHILTLKNRKFCRLDGKTPINSRQEATKAFSRPDSEMEVYLISTRAGGLGLNIPGANRVIIFDFSFNPTWEEQAVGRAFRIGQKKEVFVYRFLAGGTFEDVIHNKSLFKTQLSSRVVDKRCPVRAATKNAKDYLFEPKVVQQEDLSEFKGKDPKVLDEILARPNAIRKITLTETFHREDNDKLTPEEETAVQEELDDERLKRNDPAAWEIKNNERQRREDATLSRYRVHASSQPPRLNVAPRYTPTSPVPNQPPSSAPQMGPPPLPPDVSVSNPIPIQQASSTMHIPRPQILLPSVQTAYAPPMAPTPPAPPRHIEGSGPKNHKETPGKPAELVSITPFARVNN
ncbi:hypothetical protein FQN57_004124 [Myotisia sp. PD_48]|nr:hypothetical protein FQN57_004124 [Myotisia sp. PD_48]